MRPSTQAQLVHLFTATGAGLSMMAIIAAGQSDWRAMFLWLGAALIVDGIDGPLARKTRVQTYAPRFDGAILDLVIDFLTYVVIPIYALVTAGFLAGTSGTLVAVVVTVASALYFADTTMKTEDKSFRGFPGCWNMAALVIFATGPSAGLTALILLVLTIAMFLPVHFVHPVRTQRWRPVTLTVTAVWAVASVVVTVTAFGSPAGAWALGIASVYLLVVGAVQQATA